MNVYTYIYIYTYIHRKTITWKPMYYIYNVPTSLKQDGKGFLFHGSRHLSPDGRGPRLGLFSHRHCKTKTPPLADVSINMSRLGHSMCQEYGRTRCLFLRHGHGRVRLLDAAACVMGDLRCMKPTS